MVSTFWAIVLRYLKKLWVRIVLISALAVVAVLVAAPLGRFIPPALTDRLGQDAVLPVLTILASTMLAVTTFSLNVMVSAYRAASSQATPRAYRILLADTTTQNVLATFVGAFIFSLSAILMFRADLYDPAASVTVFGFTVGIVAMIILAILRWIEHLSLLGSMDHTMNVVGATARQSLEARRTRPCMGGVPEGPSVRPPADAAPVLARRTGYLQLVDMPRLQARLAQAEGRIWLVHVPGDHVLADTPVAFVQLPEDSDPAPYAGFFTLGTERTFEQDARYGLTVLSEIGQRAMSPGVNDPGTAIEALARLEGLLWQFGRPRDVAMPAPRFDRVHVPEIIADQLFDAAFAPIARDGAGCIEVAQRLIFALDRLGSRGAPGWQAATQRLAAYPKDHAQAALALDSDKARL